MAGIPLGTGSYRRRGARTAEVSLINCLVEKDPTNLIDGKVFIQRPGLADFANVGPGPIRGVFRKLGVLFSLYYVVSGSSLYSVTTSGIAAYLGAIPGDGLVTIAGNETRLLICDNALVYSWNGTAMTTINMPADEDVSSLEYISGYFLLCVADSDKVFWLAPGDVDPDPLSFFNVESAPDNNVAVKRLLDEVWFFGQQTIQPFQQTANIDAPFQPIIGRVYEKGCANKSTIAELDNTLYWVGSDLVVYRAETVPIRISDHSLEERLQEAGSDDLRAWAFTMNGHSLYLLRCGDDSTFAHDVENGNWPRWKSYEQDTFRAHLGTQVAGDLVIAGDDAEGKLWRFDPSISNDDGIVLERELTGGLAIVGQPQKCSSVYLAAATGWAPITGTAILPKIFMRYSDDGGNLWSSWIEVDLGLQGKYPTIAVWRRLGLMRAPARIFTFRQTDDTVFRVHYARANEAVNI